MIIKDEDAFMIITVIAEHENFLLFTQTLIINNRFTLS